MPTINQLVRKGRQTTTAKSTAPALQKGWNSKKNRATDSRSPQKEVFVQLLKQLLQRSQTQL